MIEYGRIKQREDALVHFLVVKFKSNPIGGEIHRILRASAPSLDLYVVLSYRENRSRMFRSTDGRRASLRITYRRGTCSRRENRDRDVRSYIFARARGREEGERRGDIESRIPGFLSYGPPMSRQNFNFRRAFYRDSNASLHAPPFITRRWTRIL